MNQKINKNNKFVVLGIVGALVFGLIATAIPASAQVFTQVNTNSTLKVGSRGPAVTAMQNFLASNTDVYPEGKVTGYFGTLTKNAVVQFQLYYDLTPDGIVGPATRAKMNSVIVAGRGLDIYAPVISNLSSSVVGRSASINFGANEAVSATAFYDTNRIAWHDSGLAMGTPTISGATSMDSDFEMSKQVALSNLSGNTVYNYTVMARDASGNVSVVLPRTFVSGQ